MPETAGGSATRWGPLFGSQAIAWAETWEGPGGWGRLAYEHVLDRAEIGAGTARLSHRSPKAGAESCYPRGTASCMRGRCDG